MYLIFLLVGNKIIDIQKFFVKNQNFLLKRVYVFLMGDV